MTKVNQLGDTIVEVLVAMAIVGIVLAGAFAASNRSQKSTQQAQEHTTALKIAEGQLELLKASSNPDQAGADSEIFSVAHLFCMDTSSGNVMKDNIRNGSIFVNIGSMPPNNGAADKKLRYGSCTTLNGVNYNIAVDRAQVTGTTNQYVFTVHIRWDSVQDIGHDEVTLAYKVDTP